MANNREKDMARMMEGQRRAEQRTEELNWQSYRETGRREGVGVGVGDERSVRGLGGEGKGSRVVSPGHSERSRGQNDS